jgi:hypothetical protein
VISISVGELRCTRQPHCPAIGQALALSGRSGELILSGLAAGACHLRSAVVRRCSGCGDQKLYELLALLGWDCVIRFRGAILVEGAEGEVRPANEWVRRGGRAFIIRGARVTGNKASVRGACWCTCTPAT